MEEPLSDLQKVFHKYGVETNGDTEILKALLEMGDIQKQEILRENPNAITFCNRCGGGCYVSDTDSYGYCC